MGQGGEAQVTSTHLWVSLCDSLGCDSCWSSEIKKQNPFVFSGSNSFWKPGSGSSSVASNQRKVSTSSVSPGFCPLAWECGRTLDVWWRHFEDGDLSLGTGAQSFLWMLLILSVSGFSVYVHIFDSVDRSFINFITSRFNWILRD